MKYLKTPIAGKTFKQHGGSSAQEPGESQKRKRTPCDHAYRAQAGSQDQQSCHILQIWDYIVPIAGKLAYMCRQLDSYAYNRLEAVKERFPRYIYALDEVEARFQYKMHASVPVNYFCGKEREFAYICVEQRLFKQRIALHYGSLDEGAQMADELGYSVHWYTALVAESGRKNDEATSLYARLQESNAERHLYLANLRTESARMKAQIEALQSDAVASEKDVLKVQRLRDDLADSRARRLSKCEQGVDKGKRIDSGIEDALQLTMQRAEALKQLNAAAVVEINRLQAEIQSANDGTALGLKSEQQLGETLAEMQLAVKQQKTKCAAAQAIEHQFASERRAIEQQIEAEERSFLRLKQEYLREMELILERVKNAV